MEILPQVFNPAGKVPCAPQVIRGTVDTVPALGRMGLDPVHNLRKVSLFAGCDEQVDVGRHNTKITKPESEFFFCIMQDKQHGFFADITLKNPFFVIGPGRNMIYRPFNKFPFFPHKLPPHTYIMVRKCSFAWCLAPFSVYICRLRSPQYHPN
jgi:hypothetical protein